MPAQGAAADFVVTPARSADSFVDSIGVATHLTYGDTSYGNLNLVERRLKESGIRHIRDGWGLGSPYVNTFVRERLAPAGIRLTMIQDPRQNAAPEQVKDMVKRELMPGIGSIESLNEWDLYGPNWSQEARDWTVRVSNAYRSDPATASLPIIGPSMADTNNAANHASLMNLSGYLDFGNTHDYPGNQYQMTDQIMDTVQ